METNFKLEDLDSETSALICIAAKKTVCLTTRNDSAWSFDFDDEGDFVTIVNICRAGSDVQIMTDDFLNEEQDKKYKNLIATSQREAQLYLEKEIEEFTNFKNLFDLISQPGEKFNIAIKALAVDDSVYNCITVSRKKNLET